MDLLSLVATALAFFVVAVSLGPANIWNAAVAMAHGRNVSLVYGLDLSCVWSRVLGLIAASGMGAVLQGSLLLMALKVARCSICCDWPGNRPVRSRGPRAWRLGFSTTRSIRWRFLSAALCVSTNGSAVGWTGLWPGYLPLPAWI